MENFTVATAESCTGGLIASRMTDLAGASAYVKGGIIAYNDDIKKSVLHVAAETLKNFGAVSEQTALEMARNVREIFSSTFGLSTTGIAGPTSVEGKPVGLVYVAMVGADFETVKEFHFSGSRTEIKFQAADEAFKLLHSAL